MKKLKQRVDPNVLKEQKKYFENITSLLKMHKLYPQNEDETPIGKKYYYNLWLLSSLILIFILSIIIFLVSTLTALDIHMQLIDDIGIYLSGYLMISDVMIMVLSIKKYINLKYNLCSYMNDEEKPKTMKYIPEKVDKYVKPLHLFFVILTLVVCICKSYYDEIRCQNFSSESVCGMIFSIWLPFDYNYTPVKEMIIITQSFLAALIIADFYVVAVDWVIYNAYFLSRWNHLTQLLRNMPIATENESDAFLKRWYIYHVRLLRIHEEIENVTFTRKSNLFFLISILIAMLEINVILMKSRTAAVHLYFWIVVAGVLHSVGQLFIDEGKELIQVISELRWYEMSPRLRRKIHIILLRAQKGSLSSYGPLSSCSRTTLLATLQVAYTYLAAAINMKRKYAPK